MTLLIAPQLIHQIMYYQVCFNVKQRSPHMYNYTNLEVNVVSIKG